MEISGTHNLFCWKFAVYAENYNYLRLPPYFLNPLHASTASLNHSKQSDTDDSLVLFVVRSLATDAQVARSLLQ